MTIPGVGAIAAMFMIAEIEDIARFKSYRHLASYAGLVLRIDASADKQGIGRITKQGLPYLRTALVEAAQAATRTKSRLNLIMTTDIVWTVFAVILASGAMGYILLINLLWFLLD